MKLKEKSKIQERRQRPSEVLGRLDPEAGINERLGVTEATKHQLLIALQSELRTGAVGMENLRLKLQMIVNFFILFPEERKNLEGTDDFEKFMRKGWIKYEFWDVYAQFHAPRAYIPDDGDLQEIQYRLFMARIDLSQQRLPKETTQDDEVSRLVTILKMTQDLGYRPSQVDSDMVEIQEHISNGFIPDELILQVLHADPGKHEQIKQLLRDHHTTIPKAEVDREFPDLSFSPLAASKIMLADTIEQLPNGEIRAVEGNSIQASQALPDRSVI